MNVNLNSGKFNLIKNINSDDQDVKLDANKKCETDNNILKLSECRQFLKDNPDANLPPLTNKSVQVINTESLDLEFEKIASHGYSTEISKKWMDFCLSLSLFEKKQVKKILSRYSFLLNDVSLINVVFKKIIDEHKTDYKKVYDALNNYLEESSLQWINNINNAKLGELYSLISSGQIEAGSIPLDSIKKRFQSAASSFIEGRKSEFLSIYEKASGVGKFILLKEADHIINLYDSLLQQILKNGQIPLKEKAQTYVFFLKDLYEIMKTLSFILSKKDQQKLMQDDARSNQSMEEYLQGLLAGRVYINTLDMLISPNENYKQYEVWQPNSTPVEVRPYGQLTDYFRSKGIREIIQSLPKLSESQLQREFEVRDYFTLDSFLLGSNVDRSNKLHWPTRLAEYHRVLVLSSKKIVYNEMSKYGIPLQSVPADLRNICLEFKQLFNNLDPSSIIELDGGGFEVVFDIPLRQHAAQVTFRLADMKDTTPIAMTIKAMGGDEADRWKRMAVLAALMAHKLGLTFREGIPPAINYKYTDSISFALQIPRKYPELSSFLKKIHVMLWNNTMVDDPADDRSGLSGPERFDKNVIRGAELRGYKGTKVHQFADLFNLHNIDDWAQVPGEVFSHSLYLNLYLLDYFTANKKVEVVSKIIEYSLKGLVYYQLNDYKGQGLTPDSQLYQSRFAPSPTSSLLEGMLACIDFISVSKENRDNLKFLQKAIRDYQNKHPDHEISPSP